MAAKSRLFQRFRGDERRAGSQSHAARADEIARRLGSHSARGHDLEHLQRRRIAPRQSERPKPYASASRQNLTHFASSVMRSDPAGTVYSNSIVACMGHLLSRIRRSTSAIGVSP